MATAVKAPSGRTIWKAVRDELMLNLYPLPFSTIAPAVYHVYLHPDDFDGDRRRLGAGGLADPAGADRRGREGQPRAAPLEPPGAQRACWIERTCRRSRCRPAAGRCTSAPTGTASSIAASSASSRRWRCRRPPEYAGTPTTRIVKSVVGGGRRTSSTREVAQPARVAQAGVVAAGPRSRRPGESAAGECEPTAAAPAGRTARGQPRARAAHLPGRAGPARRS